MRNVDPYLDRLRLVIFNHYFFLFWILEQHCALIKVEKRLFIVPLSLWTHMITAHTSVGIGDREDIVVWLKPSETGNHIWYLRVVWTNECGYVVVSLGKTDSGLIGLMLNTKINSHTYHWNRDRTFSGPKVKNIFSSVFVSDDLTYSSFKWKDDRCR